MSVEAAADRLKERGNEAFKAKRFGEAIDLYTQAIGAHDSTAVLPARAPH